MRKDPDIIPPTGPRLQWRGPVRRNFAYGIPPGLFYAFTRSEFLREVGGSLTVQFSHLALCENDTSRIAEADEGPVRYWAPDSLYFSEEAYLLLEPWVRRNIRYCSRIWRTRLSADQTAEFLQSVVELQSALIAARTLDDVSTYFGGDTCISSLNYLRFPKFRAAFLEVTRRAIEWLHTVPPADGFWIIGL